MPRLVPSRTELRLQPVGTFQLDEYIHDIMFSPDGTRLAAADASGQRAVWHISAQQYLSRLSIHHGAVLAVGWHPGGKILSTGGEDGVVRMWDINSGEERAVIPVGDGKGWVEHLAWESGGERLAVTSGKTLQVLKWSERGGCCVEWEISQHKSSVSDIFWRRGCPGQLFSSCFGGAMLWQVGMNSPLNEFPCDGALLSLTVSADGRYLACGNLDGSVQIWNLLTKQLWHMAGYPSKVGHVAFDPYGESLWTAAGPDVVVWSAQNFEGSSGRLLSGHSGWIQAIVCHPRQRVVATVGEDGLLCLWEPGTTNPLLCQELWVSKELSCVAWSPTEAYLAAGADDGTVALFTVEGLEEK